MKLSPLGILILVCLIAFNAAIKSENIALPFSKNDVKIKQSWLTEREKVNTSYLYRLDADRLLHNFRVNAGLPSTAKNYDGWEHPSVGLRGHFTGHYLSACAAVVANNGDTLLLSRLNYMIDVLGDCQQEMGEKYLSEGDFRCCNGTGIEAFAQLNSNIYFHNSEKLWVNLFIPSELNWAEKGVHIDQTTGFPETTRTEIKVKCKQKRKFCLNFFVPSWANSKPTILLNNKVLKANAKAGSFFTIEREWSDNDKLVVDFKFDFRIEKMKDNENVFAIFYGPLLLAFETCNELILKGSTEDILKALKKSATEMSFTLLNNGVNYKLVPFYKINTESYGVYASIRNEY